MLIYVNHVCAYIHTCTHTHTPSIYTYLPHKHKRLKLEWQSSFTIFFFKQGFPQLLDQGHVQMPFEYLQGWRFLLVSEQSVPSSVILTMGKSFLMCFLPCLCPLPLVLSLGATKESPALSLHPPSRCLHTLMRPPRALSPGWTAPALPSFPEVGVSSL